TFPLGTNGDCTGSKATTTHLAITTVPSCSGTSALNTDANGNVTCAVVTDTDAAATSIIWNSYGSIIAPTNTAATLSIGSQNGTSTLQVVGTANIQDQATTSKIVIGTNNFTTLNMVEGDVWAKRATTTHLTA